MKPFAAFRLGLFRFACLCIVAFQNGTPVFCLKLRVREPTVAYFS